MAMRCADHAMRIAAMFMNVAAQRIANLAQRSAAAMRIGASCSGTWTAMRSS
jgi:hypothetical protein